VNAFPSSVSLEWIVTDRVGIAAVGSYLPRYQIDLAEAAVMLAVAGGSGRRRVAGYDEDTATMAVEALRAAGVDRTGVAELLFATALPPYLLRTNASIVHAALDLPESVPAGDIGGGTRSWSTALRAALASVRSAHPIAVAAADMVVSRPGGPDEAEGGDAAAAIVITADDPAVVHLSSSTRTVEVLNRWRTLTDAFPQRWEERFVEAIYAPLVGPAVEEALATAGVEPGDVALCALSGGPERLLAAVRKRLPGELLLDARKNAWGNSAGALGALLLARAVSRAAPGDVVLAVHIGDGIDVDVWQVDRAPAGADSVADDGPEPRQVSYGQYLAWRGVLDVEPPRRPAPVRPAAPPSWRNRRWKYGTVAAQCNSCGHVNAPPAELCSGCGTRDDFTDRRLALSGGVASAVTVDYLAYSPSPPIVAGNVLVEGGGRLQVEMTDCRPDEVSDGQQVEFVFRRLYSAESVHDYFWKVRPTH
jgi:hydroxymethylglutaryl-CoA synthase